MDEADKNVLHTFSSKNYLEEKIVILKMDLSQALKLPSDQIKISFPTLKNFYSVNEILKSSWAIYINEKDIPKLLFSGNFLIQGNKHSKRSKKSPYGADALLELSSIANTYSYEASTYKQNWTLDLSLVDNDRNKINFTVKQYKDFLKQLNSLRAMYLLHLCEEANLDFVICEFSEPNEPLYFTDIDSLDSGATKIKSYFKLVSEASINLFKTLSVGTEFEGRFYNLQPGTWINEDVIIEMQKAYPHKFYASSKHINTYKATLPQENNPFKTEKSMI